jgi:signal transduction histidine kinase
VINAQLTQNFAHSLQPMFAAVFLYHAYTVHRLAKVELTVPYTGIVPMSLAAAGYYIFWECYRLSDAPGAVRAVGHLVWACGALMMYFHLQALQSFVRQSARWIIWPRRAILVIALTVLASLALHLATGRMFALSPDPMPGPPAAYPPDLRARVQAAFSTNGVTAALGLLMLASEISGLGYFLVRLLRRRGDRWLAFGLLLTLLAVVNDVAASMRPDSRTTSFLYVAILVEIVRLTVLIERANRDRLLRVEHSLRLAQIGEMTATMVHELANPLAILTGNAETALRQPPPSPAETRHHLTRILSASHRMSAIIDGLRDHARLPALAFEPIDVAGCLQETVQLLHPIHAKEGIALDLEIDAQLPPLRGDPGRFGQVLLNLLKNAGDATEGQATRSVRVRAFRETDRMVIEVRDNGCGIPGENLRDIFKPFYTTKPRGKGTGIGLSFADAQVRAMGGAIAVESRPGDTVFALKFPAG